MKRKTLSLCLLLWAAQSTAQTTIDQNGVKTSVTDLLAANATQPMRYEVATVCYNSFHWQNGGSIVVELFQQFYQPSYARYLVEIGYGTGANSGTPQLKLTETSGFMAARIILGNPSDLSTSYGGYVNRVLPVYCDVANYSNCRVKITYLQTPADPLVSFNQIKVNTAPTGTTTPAFNPPQLSDLPVASNKLLTITGEGNHYISNGNVGIGTTDPKEKLSVKGAIMAHKIRVTQLGWSDYVFDSSYQLKPLPQVEKYIQHNKHLPEVPSAEEVKKEGIEVGESQAMLLKKIEELTLYIIEQHKKQEALEKRVMELETKVK
ncbi:hypothetical protein HNQ91_003275 [Filimonas zeae]|uniref:Uncharacterized protein n=1 Tax=Filimonas zeae TaxID=1737353 RepID=A0A917MWP9_9BACT|nr:hypothetical protein [Filimonas zeae]MDR6340210.1 hypothetical protein [Filimonas zeae]GGH71672.1 hypothetical protein GCM10011379_31260 [Filimonas zeae]